MIEAVLLALCASIFTATSSVCQRLGARATELTAKFDLSIMLRLVRRPVWLLGIVSMIVAFAFQLSALHFGGLAIVQPVLAFELILVFVYLRILFKRKVARRDWLAVASMTGGLALFLFTASPSNGRQHAAAHTWWWAGLGVGVIVIISMAIAYDWGSHRRTSRTRRAAALGVATGASWGFVAAVIKELSSHLNQGIGAVLTNWSPYVLIATGAIAMVLESNSFSAGGLGASQPGFTITNPLVATLLGILFFGEKVRLGAFYLTGEFGSFALVIVGAVILSHSPIVVPTYQSKIDQPSR